MIWSWGSWSLLNPWIKLSSSFLTNSQTKLISLSIFNTEILKMWLYQHFPLAVWGLVCGFSNTSDWPLWWRAQQICLWLATMIIASRYSPSAYTDTHGAVWKPCLSADRSMSGYIRDPLTDPLIDTAFKQPRVYLCKHSVKSVKQWSLLMITFDNTSSCTGFILFCQTFSIQIEMQLHLPLFRLMFNSYLHVSVTWLMLVWPTFFFFFFDFSRVQSHIWQNLKPNSFKNWTDSLNGSLISSMPKGETLDVSLRRFCTDWKWGKLHRHNLIIIFFFLVKQLLLLRLFFALCCVDAMNAINSYFLQCYIT